MDSKQKCFNMMKTLIFDKLGRPSKVNDTQSSNGCFLIISLYYIQVSGLFPHTVNQLIAKTAKFSPIPTLLLKSITLIGIGFTMFLYVCLFAYFPKQLLAFHRSDCIQSKSVRWNYTRSTVDMCLALRQRILSPFLPNLRGKPVSRLRDKVIICLNYF